MKTNSLVCNAGMSTRYQKMQQSATERIDVSIEATITEAKKNIHEAIKLSPNNQIVIFLQI